MQGKHKTYPCPDCGKIFNAHYNLTRHMPVHTGARPFVCKVSYFDKRHLLISCGRFVEKALGKLLPSAGTR